MNINSVSLLNNPSVKKTSFGFSSPYAVQTTPAFSSRKQAESYKEQGNAYAQQGYKDKAIEYYLKSIQEDSTYTPSYFNLAKIYYEKGDNQKAIEYYQQILNIEPYDSEAMIDLGVIQKEVGNYRDAKLLLNQALIIDPMNDLTRRNLLETQNLELAQTNPELAEIQKSYYAQNNLQAAYAMASAFLPPEIVNNTRDVRFKFGQTALMGGDANIAQYANATKDITVTDKYLWAAPQIIAAYLVHEMVHANDKDSYSSIKEEQDAYRAAAQFWMANSNGIKDPEMDYVKELYLQDPTALDDKVAEVYKTKDPTIADFSPNHGMMAAAVTLKYKMNQATRVFNSILNRESEMKSIGILHEFQLTKNLYK